MPKNLLPNFLHDAAEYQQAEAMWRNQWDALVRSVGQEKTWQTPWLNTNFANGEPFCDGNPIFSAVCLSRRLGVCVVQAEPGDDSSEFTSWTDTFGAGEADPIKELVIHCVLSDENLRSAAELMKNWIVNKAP
jgi:hypothetical protein